MAIQTALDSISNSSGSPFGFKNRIINGDMRIDQRNAGAAVTASGSYPVDRFVIGFTSSAGTFSAQQSTTVVPTGFSSSLGVTITAADSSIAANELLQIQQWIEGNNISDLGFGTASAKTVTISFWVRSSVTGTYGFAIANSNAGTGLPNRSYVSEYTISAANTWEYKTVTIPGDTSGTWQTGNLRGMSLRFALTAGTDFQQAAGSWGTGNVNTTSNQTQLLSTNGATFYITGVQLEKGSTATSFDYRDYGRELIMCQRYYQQYINTSGSHIGPAVDIYTSNGGAGGIERNITSLPVTMASQPTMTKVGTWSASNCGQPTLAALGLTAFRTSVTVTNAGAASCSPGSGTGWTADAEL